MRPGPARGLVFIIGAAALTLRDVPRRDQLPAPAEIDDLLFSCDAAPRAAAAGGGGDGPARAYQVIGLVDSGTNWVRQLIEAVANLVEDAAHGRGRELELEAPPERLDLLHHLLNTPAARRRGRLAIVVGAASAAR